LCLASAVPCPALPSFPTRRSSDLGFREKPPDLYGGSTAQGIEIADETRFFILFSKVLRSDADMASDYRRKLQGFFIYCFGRLRRSEEHTSELQSRENLVCRLLLEK